MGFSWQFHILVVGGERQWFSWQSQMLVLLGRGEGSHGSPRCWLWGERRCSHGSPRGSPPQRGVTSLVVGGNVVILITVSHGGYWGERWRFSWQSQMLFVGAAKARLSWQSQTLVVEGDKQGVGMQGFSWQSQMLVEGGERRWFLPQSKSLVVEGGVVLMAVTESGCGGGRVWGFHGSPRCWLWGRGGISHGSSRRWLWGGEVVFSWQSQTLVVWVEAVVLMAVPDTGCGQERRGSHGSCVGRGRSSHCSPRRWLWSGEEGFSWQSQMLVVGAGKA